MTTAYVDIHNDVIALSTVPRTLEVAQDVNSAIVALIENAPSTLIRKGAFGVTYYHHWTSGDGTDISHYTEVVDLDDFKNQKIAAIKKRTDELLDAGFTYDEHTFLLTSTISTMYISLLLIDRKSGLNFPINIMDSQRVPYAIPNRTILQELLASTAAGVLEIEDTDIQLQEAVKAATTLEELDVIVDTRVPITIPTFPNISIDSYIATNHYYTNDEKETSTTAILPRERLTLSLSNIPEGIWEIDWAYELASSLKNSIAYAALYIDETEVSVHNTIGIDWCSVAGTKFRQLTGSTHVFSIMYWSESSRRAANIRRLHIHLKRCNED